MKRIFCLLLTVVIVLPSFIFSSSAANYGGNPSTAYSSGASFEEYLVSEMMSFSKSIDATTYVKKNGWNVDETTDQMEHVILNNPQLFFVETDFTMRYTTDYSYFVIEVSYSITKSQYKSAKVKFDAAVAQAVNNITAEMTDVQKAVAIHDYIAVNCLYDSSVTRFSAYDCLVGKTAVCQGYALAYSYIMNMLGIECTVIKSAEMNHAWNYIKIDGEYYHVDITFDDPTYKYNGKTYDTLGKVTHDNFMLSDSAVKKTSRPHTGWALYSGLKKATDTTYDNFFWRDVQTQIFPLGSYLYYAVADSTSPGLQKKPTSRKIITLFCRYDVSTGKSKTLNRISSVWNVWNSTTYYKSTFLRLSYYDGLFYFNTYNRVYSVSPNGKNPTVVCRPSTSSGYIYGMTVNEAGKLRIAISEGPQTKPYYKSKQL